MYERVVVTGASVCRDVDFIPMARLGSSLDPVYDGISVFVSLMFGNIVDGDGLTVTNNVETLLIFQVLAFETKLLAAFLEQVIWKYAINKDMHQVIKTPISSTFEEFAFQNMLPTLHRRIDSVRA